MKLKICGLTGPTDIEYANLVLPDYIGFVFAESKRQVTLEQAQTLRKHLSKEIIPVGVFRDALIELISELYEKGIISIAQLHGKEDSAYITDLKKRCDIPIIKAVKVNTTDDIIKADALDVNYLLLDSGGGTGVIFDWSLIQRPSKPFFIAGGITVDNITDAFFYKPYGIDVSSGAERDGLKNLTLMKEMKLKTEHSSM